MTRTVTRPKIIVQAAYMSEKDMSEVFISLLVSEVQRGKNSVRTFEIVKDTEYNIGTTQIKEAS